MVREVKKEIEIWENKKIVYEKESGFLDIKNMTTKILNATVKEKIRTEEKFRIGRRIWRLHAL